LTPMISKHRVFNDEHRNFLLNEVFNAFDKAFREHDRQALLARKQRRGTQPEERRARTQNTSTRAIVPARPIRSTLHLADAVERAAAGAPKSRRPFDPAFVAMFAPRERAS